MSGISVLVLILILSFALERVVKAFLFLLSYVPIWCRFAPDPRMIDNVIERIRAEKKQKLIYTLIVAILGGILVNVYPDIRLIQNLVGETTNPYLDMIVTVIVLLAGSDIVGRLLNISGIGEMDTGAASTRSEPIEITGKLILEDQNNAGRRFTST